jgi:hypothetical protein
MPWAHGPESGATYLLHFSQPYPRGKHPQHYLGWALAPHDRLRDHQQGGWAAACLTRAAVAEDIALSIVRLWPGGVATERRLKKRKAPKRLCPVCRGTGVTP